MAFYISESSHNHISIIYLSPGMITNMKYLEGIAIKDITSQPHVVRFFPEWDLPEDVSERFKVLFQTREKWTIDEIRPFVE